MTSEPVQIEARKAIPASWKAAALARTEGVCARLDCDRADGLEFDHILALALGGKHAADNIEPLCRPHHRAKTDRDLAMIARAKRRSGGGSIPARKSPWPPKGSRKLPTKAKREAANENAPDGEGRAAG